MEAKRRATTSFGVYVARPIIYIIACVYVRVFVRCVRVHDEYVIKFSSLPKTVQSVFFSPNIWKVKYDSLRERFVFIIIILLSTETEREKQGPCVIHVYISSSTFEQ